MLVIGLGSYGQNPSPQPWLDTSILGLGLYGGSITLALAL